MRTRGNLFWGIALITFGVLFFSRNMGWLQVDWATIRDLWPVLLILAGINVILQRQRSSAALFTTVLLGVAVPFALFGYIQRDRYDRFDYRSERPYDDGENTDDDDDEEAYQAERRERRDTYRSDSFTESMTPDTREAVLKIEGGASRFVIDEPTTELIKADTKLSVGNYSMSVERDPTSRIPTIELKPNEGHMRIKNGRIDNRVSVQLNEKPLWDIEVDMGAGAGDFDLSRYTVRNVDIEAGAADIDLKLGDKAPQTDVKISAGVASITVQVPKGVGCRIVKDGALNIEQLDDFTKVDDGSYVTPGFNSAARKIAIRYEGGMSKFKVVRY